MRRFTETEKDNPFWWSPTGWRLRPPARRKGSDCRSPLQRLRASFGTDRRHCPHACAYATRDPKTRVSRFGRGMPCPKTQGDPASLAPAVGRPSYDALSRLGSSYSSHSPTFGLIVADALGASAYPHFATPIPSKLDGSFKASRLHVSTAKRNWMPSRGIYGWRNEGNGSGRASAWRG